MLSDVPDDEWTSMESLAALILAPNLNCHEWCLNATVLRTVLQLRNNAYRSFQKDGGRWHNEQSTSSLQFFRKNSDEELSVFLREKKFLI